MKLRILVLLLLSALTISSFNSSAQLVGTNVFLQGSFLEVGVAANGSFGPASAPAGYHAGPGPNLAMVYDYGLDGWTVGTPPKFGDYVYPGTAFEGWTMQVNGARTDAFYTVGAGTGFWNAIPATSTLTGSNTSYTNLPTAATCGFPPTGHRIAGVWSGTAGAGAGLTIRQTTTIDTNDSWVNITTVFKNTTATDMDGLYYWRTCDPDNEQTNSGSFETTNWITKQNDEAHRVLVNSRGNTYTNAYMGLCTKDCRAKCLIYTNWSPYPAQAVANTLDLVYNETATFLGTSGYNVGYQTSADIAFGLIYNLGTLPAGDSTIISYAYIFSDTSAIDLAFPEPQLVTNCVPAAPSGPAPAPTYDTFRACEHPGVAIIPVYVKYGGDKCWSWSKWNWAPATGLATVTGLNNNITISALPGPTTYTITGTDSATGMYSCNQRTFYLTVIPCFSATSNSPDDDRICVDDTLRLFAHGDSTDATYIWYGPGITGPVRGLTQYIKVPHITMADTGWYFVVKTVGTDHDTVSTHVLFKPKPIITATYNPPVCSGNSLLLYSNPDSVGETWIWTGPAGFSSTASDPTRITAPTSYSGVYSVIATFNGCIDSTTLSVTVDSTPEVPAIASNSPVCEGDTLFLTSSCATPGVTYSWTGPSGFSSTLQNPVMPNAPLTASGTYTVTVSTGTCTKSNSILVEIRHTPVPILGSNAPVCSGTPLNLTTTAPPGSTFEWTGPNSFGSTIQNPSINPAITANTGTYSVIVTLNGCPSDLTTIYAQVDTTPDLTLLATNSPGAPGPSICEGDTLTFAAASSTLGVGYVWTGPNFFTSSDQNPYILDVTTAATGVYTLVVSVASCSVTAAIGVFITATPSITATSNTPVCSGSLDTLQLHATSNAGATFTWTGPYVFLSNAQDPMRTPVSVEYAGVYHVEVELDGCSNETTTTVVVNPTPDPPWVKWLTYCQYYDAPYLQAFGSNILWYSASSGSVGTTVPPKPQTDVVGYTYYYANQTVSDCPSGIDSIRVTVTPTPTVTVTPDVVVCPRDSVVLTAVNTDDVAYYHWYPSMYLSDTSGPSVVTHPETNMEYAVITSNSYGCSDTAMVNVTVRPAAVIFLRDSVTLYPGESYQIEPSTNCTIFSWTPVGGLNNKYYANPVASPEVSTKYVVTGVTEWGCRTKDSINVNISTESLLTLPNAFAPGNGANGLFKIIRRGTAALRHFRIYDRWGVVVFETNNIEEGWDGTFKGTPQPVGVYVYDVSAITSAGKSFSKTGNVTLLR